MGFPPPPLPCTSLGSIAEDRREFPLESSDGVTFASEALDPSTSWSDRNRIGCYRVSIDHQGLASGCRTLAIPRRALFPNICRFILASCPHQEWIGLILGSRIDVISSQRTSIVVNNVVSEYIYPALNCDIRQYGLLQKYSILMSSWSFEVQCKSLMVVRCTPSSMIFEVCPSSIILACYSRMRHCMYQGSLMLHSGVFNPRHKLDNLRLIFRATHGFHSPCNNRSHTRWHRTLPALLR